MSAAQARHGEETKLLLELEAGSSFYGLEVWLQKAQTAVAEQFSLVGTRVFRLGHFSGIWICWLL